MGSAVPHYHSCFSPSPAPPRVPPLPSRKLVAAASYWFFQAPAVGLLKQSGSQQIQKDKTLPLEECLTLLGVQSSLTKREIWRLATSSLLHANIGRRMVNCYSLNSDGPTMENLSGPRRFLVVYFTSALSSVVSTVLKRTFLNASNAFAPAFQRLVVMNVDHAGYWANV
ncbi:hypothetical protein GOBAR_AA12588 [Gossypium barbadense]|uniref:Peptidase S54 rhomboid domain-containing protein n=1 Tax=Gossypium barbadense TaxID=3634 RepID=A0A2P5XXH9_GOSBA|nr:hypothetical protein GOBAR_AA12588 [Gossypium barbadense]